ncbi:hypothetical protein SETIT_3G378800v2 [Setaria italica]|uniref:Uncharacterized protein n=1 Tax=Setaria italica TaxID=4555 RepID=A0A368QN17_SETIT|nr:hypothetical protein SETIT_3G378800v2 [Setaria italica]
MAMNSSAVAIQAAVDGNLRLLKKMASKIDLREANDPSSGWNALHFAAVRGTTPVNHAAAAGEVSVLRYLLDHGGDPAMPDAMGTMPLQVAADSGETPILLATDAMEDRTDNVIPVLSDPLVPDDKGYTPLHDAAEHGHHEAVRVLLSKGVPVDPINRRGTPLHLAPAKDHDQAVNILLEHGADPNRVASRILSPLAHACYGHSFKCVKLLVEVGADVNLKGPTGRPVLFSAVEEGLTDIVKFLLEAGADPNIHDGCRKLPIMLAAAHEQRELVNILLPWTKPIPSIPDWNIDGIIRTMKYLWLEPQAIEIDPHDTTSFANRSLCWLRLGEGELALSDARRCTALAP